MPPCSTKSKASYKISFRIRFKKKYIISFCRGQLDRIEHDNIFIWHPSHPY